MAKRKRKKALREWTGTARANTEARRITPGGQLKQKPNGTFVFVPAKPKKKATAKQRVANVQNRIAAESDRHAAHLAGRPKPMTERVQRKADGTFNGSKPAKLTPEQREAARIARSSTAAYNRASKSAAASERRIRRELGH